MKLSVLRHKALLFLFSVAFFTSASATTVIVTLTNFVFTPADFTINVGDTVKWVEGSGAGHTTASSVIPSGAASWNSPIGTDNPSFIYPVLVAGTYHYVCLAHESLGMIAQFTAVSATGINSPFDNGSSVSVVTNPVKNQVVLQFNLQKPTQVEISLYDLLGKKLEVLSSGMMKDGEYTNSYSFSQAYHQGIYFLAINLGDMRLTERIVIQ